MGTIVGLYKSVKALDMRRQVPILIEQTSEEIIALNQKQLYNSSVTSEGLALRLYRNIPYAALKSRMNPNPGFRRPDLYLTGAFYRGFKVTVKPPFYIVTSTDAKTGKLIEQYGKDIFGLTTDNKAIYGDGTFLRAFMNYIKLYTGL